MEKRLKVIIAIVVVALFVSSLIVVRLPSPLGSIIVPDDYSSIQTAVDHAFAGQTIFVRNGIYHGQTIIDKPLTLIGEDSKNTILEGISDVKYPPPYVIQISADNVKVSGFTITNGYQGGIRVETIGSDVQPTGCIIIGNNIMNNSNGISTYDGNDLTISNNNISDNRQSGVQLYSSHSTISENTIAQNGFTGLIVSSSNVMITQNTITGNGFQADVVNEQGGLKLYWDGNYNVYANNITNNNGFGLQFGENCNNSTVNDNNIEGNNVGVDLLNFALTNSSDSGIGIGNKVYENNLDNSKNVFIETAFAYGNISTVFDAIGNGTDIVSWDNGTLGNHWSDYIGQGTYVIDENNVDHHPLIQTVDISTTTRIEPASILTVAVIIAVAVLVVVVISLLLYRRYRKNSTLSK